MRLVPTGETIRDAYGDVGTVYNAAPYPYFRVIVAEYPNGRRYVSMSNHGLPIKPAMRRGVFDALKIKKAVKVNADALAKMIGIGKSVAEHYVEA